MKPFDRSRKILDILAAEESLRALAEAGGLRRERDFMYSDCRGVDFGEDDLSGFDFSGSDVSGANFSRASGLSPSQFRGAVGAETAEWPEYFDSSFVTRPLKDANSTTTAPLDRPVPRMWELVGEPAHKLLWESPELLSTRRFRVAPHMLLGSALRRVLSEGKHQLGQQVPAMWKKEYPQLEFDLLSDRDIDYVLRGKLLPLGAALLAFLLLYNRSRENRTSIGGIGGVDLCVFGISRLDELESNLNVWHRIKRHEYSIDLKIWMNAKLFKSSYIEAENIVQKLELFHHPGFHVTHRIPTRED